MCSIAGCFFGAGPFGSEDAARLAALDAAQAHRGPDGAGAWRGAACALAHRRLAVQDLTPAAAQPMLHACGAALVFNGELYGIAALRDELAGRGHAFRGHGDTEVLLAACVEWGAATAAARIEGIYAFAFFDPRSGTLDLVRDPAGVKPLFHATDAAGRTWFASELAPLVDHAPLTRRLDRAGLGAYARLGFVPAPRTIYDGIGALAPGARLTLHSGATPELHAATPAPVDAPPPTYAEAVERCAELLARAVERQMVADVPLGAFLSGGIDSSTLCAVAVRRLGLDLRTFSIGLDDPLLDETRWAELVARHLGTRHVTLRVGVDEARAALGPMLAQQGQPFADPSLIPTSVVARLARGAVTVALSGDGADEAFGGYAKYLADSLGPRWRAVPAPLRAAARAALGALPATRTSRLGERVRRWRKFAAAAGLPDDARWLALQSLLPPARAASLYRADVLDTAWLEADVAARCAAAGQGLAATLAVDAALTLPSRMLYKVDAASMAHALEVRVPFLDGALLSFARGLPPSWKVLGRARKRVLRDAGLPLLPPELAHRPKQGFDIPVGRWLAGPLAEEFRDLVASAPARGLLDAPAVEMLYRDHVGRREAADAALWSVYCLAHWALRRGVSA